MVTVTMALALALSFRRLSMLPSLIEHVHLWYICVRAHKIVPTLAFIAQTHIVMVRRGTASPPIKIRPEFRPRF